jgi:hypothetical protein
MTKAKGRDDPQIVAEMEILRYARGQRSRDFSVFIRRTGDRWEVETFDAEIETISLGSGTTLAEAWHSQEDVRENVVWAMRADAWRDN